MSISVGDLVCMYRRRKKCLGIVLESVPDIVHAAGVEISFDELMDKLTNLQYDKEGRMKFKRNLRKSASRPELLNTAFVFNAAWAKKRKKEFIRIRWFQRPSVYDTQESHFDEEWCPTDWVRKV